MPRDTRAAAHKRAREKAQQARQKQKQQTPHRSSRTKGPAKLQAAEDPDIAGIQPGPQPQARMA